MAAQDTIFSSHSRSTQSTSEDVLEILYAEAASAARCDSALTPDILFADIAGYGTKRSDTRYGAA